MFNLIQTEQELLIELQILYFSLFLYSHLVFVYYKYAGTYHCIAIR